MKKLLLLFVFGLFFCPVTVRAEELIPNATSGLLMEASTGKIIFEKDKDKQVPIASMTKMVAQIIILENIEEGKIQWDDVIEVSKNASEMGGSQIYLEPGEKMTVKDLFKGISMASANDATVQMAEVIGSSEKGFVKLMNQKVKDLGLKNTHFENCTGLDQDGHYSSAHDMGIIARELLTHEQILNFSSVYEDYLRQNTEKKFWLVNTNKLVRFYEGADGLKTGHTDAAKYCLAATAKRNDMRLIAIVLGEEESKVRNAETISLLDYGFNTVKVQMLKKKGEKIDEIPIEKGSKNKIALVTENDVSVLQDRGTKDKKYTIETDVDKIKLPVKKGQVLGSIIVKEKDNIVVQKDLIAKNSVDKLSYFELVLNTLKKAVTGDIN